MPDSTRTLPKREAATQTRTLPEPEIQIAAAALAAVVSAPLGVAVAIGSALRSPRVRDTLRRGTVQALAGAIQLGDQLTVAAHRVQNAAPATASPDPAPNGHPPAVSTPTN